MHMLNHISIAVTDLKRAAAFYDPVLAALGYRRVCSGESFIGYGVIDDQDEFSLKLRPAGIAVPGAGFHVAFSAPSRKAVGHFYHAALASGGKDNGGFGLHPEYGPNYYAAFVTDPEGYWVEAVIHGPA